MWALFSRTYSIVQIIFLVPIATRIIGMLMTVLSGNSSTFVSEDDQA